MDITLTTPALLFPAISLLLLAYTNRFLAIAAVIRQLHGNYQNNGDKLLESQIVLLKRRVLLIRRMQWVGVFSLLLCTITMFLMFLNLKLAGEIVFGFSLLSFTTSLGISLQEIQLSVNALNLELSDLSKEHGPCPFRDQVDGQCQLGREKTGKKSPQHPH